MVPAAHKHKKCGQTPARVAKSSHRFDTRRLPSPPIPKPCIFAQPFLSSHFSPSPFSPRRRNRPGRIPDPGSYRFIKDILIGGTGGWDYLSVDPAARRLYVAHGVKIEVIDLDKDAVVGEIADTPRVHGFAIAPDLGMGFSSNGDEAKASAVDLKTLKTVFKVPTGENPDAILYAPDAKEVYTFNGGGKSATVFAALSGSVVATIPLDGKPEFAAFKYP